MSVSDEDSKELATAVALLSSPGLAMKVANWVGKPIEWGYEKLPSGAQKKIGELTASAVEKAATGALFTLKDVPGEGSSNLMHKVGAAVSGGVGGAFGMAALAVELPFSTTIMLRSIADIARSEGEALSDPQVKVECISVLAMGGLSEKDDAAESAYYAVRAVLAKSVSGAIEHLASKEAQKEAAPALIKFILMVAERFGVQVSEKVLAQMVPAIGALGGASLNWMFLDHFQDMARGHFAVRRLERKYGQVVIRPLVEQLLKERARIAQLAEATA